jgi:hypothetical protein
MAKHLGNHRKQQRGLIWIGISKVIVEDVNQDIPGGEWWEEEKKNVMIMMMMMESMSAENIQNDAGTRTG